MALRTALAALPDAFALVGDGPRAFQDLDLLAADKANPIEALLIDAPSDNAAKFRRVF